MCWKPGFLHAGYFLGKMKSQNLNFINLTLYVLVGGYATSLKSSNYRKTCNKSLLLFSLQVDSHWRLTLIKLIIILSYHNKMLFVGSILRKFMKSVIHYSFKISFTWTASVEWIAIVFIQLNNEYMLHELNHKWVHASWNQLHK